MVVGHIGHIDVGLLGVLIVFLWAACAQIKTLDP